MTREEAKQVFLSRGYIEVEGGSIYAPDKWRESCRIISEWLEQQPCDDATLKDIFCMGCEYKEQKPKTWSLDDAREDFMHDVYNTLDFLPTNDEANQIIDSFDRVTSSIEQQPCEDAISRQAVLNEAFEVDTKEYGRIEVVGVDVINSLLPVTSQQKMEHWIEHKCNGMEYIECPKCSTWFLKMYLTRNSYCPNCGQKLDWESEDKE